MRRILGSCVCVGLALAPIAWAQSPGARLYEEHCALCHGTQGHEGFAANIAAPRLPRAPDDRALFRLIKNGVEGTDMPPAYGVTDAEVEQIIAWVRTLGRAAAQPAPGNPARGRDLYWNKGNCSQCHMLAGRGGRQGPDLSEIGARRGATHLRQSLVEPEGAVPFGFLLVDVSMRDARKISGVRLNEDSFSIQIRDLKDAVHSLWKEDVREVRKNWGKSPMPSYRDVLTTAELDDMVAYLTSLRGGL